MFSLTKPLTPVAAIAVLTMIFAPAVIQSRHAGASATTVARAWLGDGGAANDVGLAFEAAGPRQDPAAAVAWFRRAAERGDSSGQYNLAQHLREGDGVAADLAQAAVLYRAAAEQGDGLAMVNLGMVYARGAGVPVDLAEAARWHRRAADAGMPLGMVNLAVMRMRGLPEGPPWPEAKALLEKAASLGEPLAYFNLAVVARDGAGPLPADPPAARRLFLKGVELGDPAAMTNLGALHFDGVGGPVDRVAGYKWLKIGIERGAKVADPKALFAPLEAQMAPAELAEANRAVEAWKKAHPAGG